MRKFGLLVFLSLSAIYSFSQDFSNKGKDFWVGYGYHQIMTNGNFQEMRLYFATEAVTTVTVSIPGLGYSVTYSNIAANTVFTSNPLPKAGAQDARLFSESIVPDNKGIHIVADKPIVAYAHIYNQSVSGASILFPTNTLGKEYYSVNYTNISNTEDANCWFYVVACDTGTTTVEITPSVNTINHPAGTTFTVNLAQGQIYNVMATFNNFTNPMQGGDLTGSKIKSVSGGSGGCKRIGVFSGSGRISITCNGGSGSSDNYMVQAFPKSAWGKKYLTAHTGGLINNFYRVCVTDPATVVTVNGAPISVPLTSNFYYQLGPTSSQLKIEADLPILVAQYITSQGDCGNGNPGDPEVIYLSPVEQNISKVLWNATGNFNITAHYYNVVIPNTGTGISSFRLDGATVNPSLFQVHPQDPNYSYLIQNIIAGQHRIESDSGFNAIAYGFGAAESYGYNAGTNIRDLYNVLRPLNPYSLVPDPVACTGTPFYLTITFPFQPTSIYWDFHGYQTNATVSVPVPDSTYFVGSRQVWRYKLPTPYVYSPTEIYPITIIAGTTTSEGCGNTYERDFDLHVYDPPTALIDWFTHSGCISDSVYFRDTTDYETGTYSYKWFWDFGDGKIDSVRYPTHKYLVPGTYRVKFAMISNVGCFSDTGTRSITVNPPPLATISGNATVCKNATPPGITFTGSNGTAPYTFTYSLNGGSPSAITTTAGNSVNIFAPTGVVGTYAYTLLNVTGASCSQAQAGSATIIVNPLPTASISGNATVCANTASPTITFTGANGVAGPYTFTYTINGGSPQTVTSSAGNSAVISVPTGTPGTFTYTLTSVKEGSPSACFQNQSGTAVVTVNPLPTAVITGSNAMCLNAAPPQITFTGANATAPYTFTYNINGGPAQTLSTLTGNSVSVTVPTSVAGTFTYSLVSVRDASSTTCSQLQNGSAVITVYPLPIADFTNDVLACALKKMNFTDASSPLSGSLNEWHWHFGDLPSGTENTSDIRFPSHTFTNPGTYPVTLIVKTDRGCQSLPKVKDIIIYARPVAGFVNPEVCLTDTYALFDDTSKVQGGTIAAWLWDFGEPSSGALNSSILTDPQHSYGSLGIKNITLIVTSNDNCKDTLHQSFTINGDLPLADFIVNNPSGLCANDSVTLSNISSVNVGNIVRLEIFWDNVGTPGASQLDEDPFSNKVYRHLYPNLQTDKTYTIRWVSYSGFSCVDEKTVNVLVHAAPKVRFDPIPNTCYNVPAFQITQASEPNGVLEASHVFSGPGITPTGIFDPAIAGIGTHIIKYKFTSVNGCVDSASQTIKVRDTASALFSYNNPVCETQVTSFREGSVNPAGIILSNTTWDFGDGSLPEDHLPGSTFGHTFSSAGNYTVKMFNTSADGCLSFPRFLELHVNPQPLPNFNLYKDTVCIPNALVQFRNLSSIADNSGLTYSWNFGDVSLINNTSTALEPGHLYNSTGPFSVKLEARSAAGCIKDTIIPVNAVHPQPEAAMVPGIPSACIGDELSLRDQSDPKDGTAWQWQWDFGNGHYSTNPNPSYTYPSVGQYTITFYMVNSLGCNSDTITQVFNVYPYPVVDAGPDIFVLEGQNTILHPTVSGNDLSFEWLPDQYLNNNNIEFPVITPHTDTWYTLWVTGRGECRSHDSLFVKVLMTPLIPNTFTPNNDGINDVWRIKYLDDYPNNRVQVFTRTGQLVFESRGYRTSWDGKMNGKSLPFDTYYFIIEPESGRKPVTGYITIVK